jgi:hypothetical protein
MSILRSEIENEDGVVFIRYVCHCGVKKNSLLGAVSAPSNMEFQQSWNDAWIYYATSALR